MSAVATVARAFLPRVAGTSSANAMSHTATGDHPFGIWPGGAGQQWYVTAMRNPIPTS